MSITEDELVDAYGSSNAEERFDLIYENYSVFPLLVDCFEIGLFTMKVHCWILWDFIRLRSSLRKQRQFTTITEGMCDSLIEKISDL